MIYLFRRFVINDEKKEVINTLDKKKLNSIAQKLNVSINFDSDTPGVTVGHGESKKITSFDFLIGYFEKDNTR